MRYLLDTHVWIWLLDSPERLSRPAARAIQAGANEALAISAISAWEIARKCSLGKLRLSMTSRVWLEKASRAPGIHLLPMSPEIAWESCNLPGQFHRDPADQLIVATARIHGLSLITCDKRLLAYTEVQTVW